MSILFKVDVIFGFTYVCVVEIAIVDNVGEN